MKAIIKKFLIKLHLWETAVFLRLLPSMVSWRRNGYSGNAPHPLKMRIVKAYLKKFKINCFVETGTYLGDTLCYVSRSGVECYSIELSPELHRAAAERFAGRRNVRLLLGDSGVKLPELIKGISQPCLFWLDGHYSEGITACAELHTPASAELKAILEHQVKKHVILIDDACCFEGKNGFPHLDELLYLIRKDGNYNAEVSTDIVRLTPKMR